MSEKQRIPESEDPQVISGEGDQKEDLTSPDRILELSPKELVGLFADLDGRGELKSFLEKSVDNPSLIAQFSYWEKWLEQDHRKLVDKIVAKKGEVYEGVEDKN